MQPSPRPRSRRSAADISALVVLCGVFGCRLDFPEPDFPTYDASPRQGDGSGGGAADDGGRLTEAKCEATTSSILTLFANRCASAGCHGSKNPVVGLDLVSPGLESRLLNVTARGCRPDLLIVPGHPEQSLMLTKVSAATPECGLAMPISAPVLGAAEIECIRG